jgi:HEAT repeat protein
MIGDKRATEELKKRLNDGSWTVKLAAARALRKLGDSSVIPLLVKWAKQESEEVRQTAIFELGEARAKSAVPVLVGFLKNPKWNVSELSAKTLGEIGDAAPESPLQAALGDENVNIRAAAADALGKIGDVAAVPALTEAIADWPIKVRRNAAKALGEIACLLPDDCVFVSMGNILVPLLLASHKDALVASSRFNSQKFVPDFFAPAGHIVLGVGVAGPDLQHLTHFDAADAFLGLQQWAWTGHRTGIYNLCSLDSGQINSSHRFSPFW